MKTIRLLFLITLFIAYTHMLFSQIQDESNLSSGPGKGTLIAVGGGYIPDSIIDEFIVLAGGTDAPIVLIPTASENPDTTGIQKMWRDKGVKNISVLHTKNKETANSKEFTRPLRKAKAVWFGGGRQWRLVDSYKGTKTEKLLWKILERGGVIGGSSAGATIQGSYLARGDTKNNQIMMGDHEEGFGFLRNVAIDQHVIARNRHFDMFDILKNKPELLGISIDENTAIKVQDGSFEVLGESYVIVYDGSFWSREGSDLKTLPEKEKLFYFLREGDKYDIKSRKIIEN